MEILHGIVHQTSNDIKQALEKDITILDKWNKLTPIQRNEWICWITAVKKPQTRENHINRMIESLKEGKRNPCCWAGCPHRKK